MTDTNKWDYDAPIAVGNHGGLRMRLLTSAQLGMQQLLFPAALAIVGFCIIEYGLDAIINGLRLIA